MSDSIGQQFTRAVENITLCVPDEEVTTSPVPLCWGCRTQVGEVWATVSLIQHGGIWCVGCYATDKAQA